MEFHYIFYRSDPLLSRTLDLLKHAKSLFFNMPSFFLKGKMSGNYEETDMNVHLNIP